MIFGIENFVWLTTSMHVYTMVFFFFFVLLRHFGALMGNGFYYYFIYACLGISANFLLLIKSKNLLKSKNPKYRNSKYLMKCDVHF